MRVATSFRSSRVLIASPADYIIARACIRYHVAQRQLVRRRVRHPVRDALPHAAGIASARSRRDLGELWAIFSAMCIMPTTTPPQRRFGSPWYSFSVGPIAVVVMSTEHDFSPGSAQFAEISRMLAAVDRGVTPWLVFAGHRRAGMSHSVLP